MLGIKKCPESIKLSYRKAIKYTCEVCNKKEEEVGKLTPHRIIRGNSGGTYKPSNVKMVCNKCHKLLHGREFL